MDYDFSCLSTRSFEQMVQALAVAVIGPGIVIFGDGPDGGREATFDGPIPFPDLATPWNGYGIVQAKFRQRGQGSEKDSEWALKELKKELAKFIDPKRKLKKPAFYLFVTNVVLTPVARQGGKDRVLQYLEGLKRKLGLKGFCLWDYDQLRALLDVHGGVRSAYTAWITPGDALFAVLDSLHPQKPDFGSVMINYVQKELLADQYVNLGQAGHNAQDRTPLAKVFVDLPLQEPQKLETVSNTNTASNLTSRTAIQLLLDLGGQRLDPDSNVVAPRDGVSHVAGRIVFIGGPGQGKSTLSQFLCQIHRVGLLTKQTHISMVPEAIEACSLICQQCNNEALALPPVPRFPVRVELNRFASALAEGHADSLFDYVRKRIARRAERELSAVDLRAWLAEYPWLLVLDGLDEVPASSNRAQVLEAIHNFLVDARECKADLLLVTTTRPQGYNDEFSPRYYSHHQLRPLEVPEALRYAKRLINQRWGGDVDKEQILLQRMQQAGAEEATARLMRSPLQVTIMALLVESIGQPPKERWRLFNDYYQVIFRRERERNIPAAALLNAYQTDIDSIHQQVGLRLQMASEQSGGTEALLSLDQFARLVTKRLEQEGHIGEEGEQLRKGILEAALDRLVFLVAPQQGKIGFEIRSLQEFMAAQYLMSGSDEAIRRNLRAIAPAAHWRNVFLFAAGRCFHEKQHLRDSLYALCGELNEGECVAGGGDLEKNILAGSRLSLDILEDGALANQPLQLKKFVRLALRLLELPPCSDQSRLATIYQPDFDDLFQEEIERGLSQDQSERKLGAWVLVLQLFDRDRVWVEPLAKKYWPKDPSEVLQIVKAYKDDINCAWLMERMLDAVFQLPPTMFGREIVRQGGFFKSIKNTDGLGRILHSLIDLPRLGWLEVPIKGVNENFHLTLPGLNLERTSARLANSINQDKHWAWTWIVDAVNFSCSPSKNSLAAILERWQSANPQIEWTSIGRYGNGISWPIAACLSSIQHGANLTSIIENVLNGKLGDRGDWQLAEERWRDVGITMDDFSYHPEENLPFDNNISKNGFPFDLALASYTHGRSIIDIIKSLVRIWHEVPNPMSKKRLSNYLLFLIPLVVEEEPGTDLEFSVSELKNLIDSAQPRWVNISILKALTKEAWSDDSVTDILTKLGDCPLLRAQCDSGNRNDKLELFVLRHPNNGSLWRLLAAACIGGYRPQFSQLIANPAVWADSSYQTAALLIQLAQGHLRMEQAEYIAKMHGSERSIVEDALRILANKNNDFVTYETFLTTLFNLLPSTSWEARRDVAGVIFEQQRQRLSDSPNLL